MKKIFTLAIALIAFASVASAQKTMYVNEKYGTVTEFYVPSVASVTFSEAEWTPIGEGTYTLASIGISGSARTCYLYQNCEDATKWKIEGWMNDLPLTFSYDETTGKVVVDDQDTGFYSSTYGEDQWIDEANDFLSKYNISGWSSGDAPYSYYSSDDDTFYFSVAYYLPILGSYYGFTGRNSKDYETYALTTRYDYSAPAKKDVAQDLVEGVAEPIK